MQKRILIVDDDACIITALNLIFRDKDYVIQTSLKGSIFLKALPFKPDLILLDKQLGEMDGAEICKALKHDVNTKNIPVILMSSVDGLPAIAKNAGADDFIEKPFNIPELLEKVSRAIEKHPGSSALASAPARND